ncbi:hypothetical protein Hanom_Chr04g00305151 [Helianthus anomalus]
MSYKCWNFNRRSRPFSFRRHWLNRTCWNRSCKCFDFPWRNPFWSRNRSSKLQELDQGPT